jgi:hypothetical protein
VSVDFSAVPRVPVRLDRVSDTTSEVLRKLTGFADPPSPVFIADVVRDGGRVVSQGRRLVRADLEAITLPSEYENVGERLLGTRLGSYDYDVMLEGLVERSSILVIGLPGRTLPTRGGTVDVLVSPTRTCVGLVMTIALALAIALESQGEFDDGEVMLLGRPGPRDPRIFIDTTQATWQPTDFIKGCTSFMRQFPALQGWPPDASLPLEPNH